MTIRRLICTLLWVMFLSAPGPAALAQNDSSAAVPPALPHTLHFNHLDTDQGLSASGVTAIVQDESGFIWLATQNGLNRFDGYTFKVYTHNPQDPDSLASSNLRTLLVEDGRLWIGAWGGGLDELDLSTGRLIHHASDPQDSSSSFISAVCKDETGGLWLGSEGGLYRFDPAGGGFQAVLLPTESQPRVYALAGTGGVLWIGTDRGLARLEGAGAQAVFHPDLGERRVLSLYVDVRHGQVWAGTDQGLFRLAQDFSAPLSVFPPADPLSTAVVTSLSSQDGERLWVGTNVGLLALDLNAPPPALPLTLAHYTHDPADPASLAEDYVKAILQDRAGSLWVTHWTEGLSFYNPSSAKFPPVIPAPMPLAFAPDGAGGLWLGSFNGLLHLDGAYRQIEALDAAHSGLPADLVFDILYDRQGVLWAGTAGGLAFLEPGKHIFTPLPVGPDGTPGPRLRSVYQDSRGRLWAGATSGLGLLSPAGGWQHFHHDPADPHSLSSETVLAIYEDRQGVLWFGADDGLNRLEEETGGDGSRLSFSQPFNNPGSPAYLGSLMVTVIEEDRLGDLWVGTWGGGVARIDPLRQVVVRWGKQDGLADDVVLGILEDQNGFIWISTSRGLSRYDPPAGTFRTYDRSDGLVDIDFSQGAYFARPDGELLFGGETGITHFYPQQLSDNPYVPPVMLTGFLLFNQPVLPAADGPLQQPAEHTGQITLSHEQTVLSFEFTALNFASPEKNQYAYRLEGLDPGWSYTAAQRRFITYTNLDPGAYTFRVRASNNDGLWNEEGLSLRLTVLPPWWQTWWAYALYGLLGIGAINLFVYLRTRRQRQSLAIQQKLLAQERKLRALLERIDEVQEEDRRRIAREMHDGLAQTLAALRMRSQVWRHMTVSQPERLSSELAGLDAILSDSILELRRTIYNLRPLALDEHGLFPALCILADEVSQQYGVKIEIEINCPAESILHSMEQPLFRIAQELLHNVGKHAQADQARLILEGGPGCLRLAVQDNGRGFDPARQVVEEAGRRVIQEGGLGLLQLRERVELLGGFLRIESAPGQGASISIELPVEIPILHLEAADAGATPPR